MQNPAFWCICGSENGQLLARADPEGTDRGEGWVAEGIIYLVGHPNHDDDRG